MHALGIPSSTTAAALGAKHDIAIRTRTRQRLAYAALLSLVLHGLLLGTFGIPTTTTSSSAAAHALQVVLKSSQPVIEHMPIPQPTLSRRLDRNPAKLPVQRSQSMEMPTAVLPALRSEHPSGTPIFTDKDQSAVDIETVRETARALTRDAMRASTRGMTTRSPAFTIPRPEPEAEPTAMARAIVRSTNSNCREKYAGAGLLGLPFLIKDQFSDSGCIW